MGRPREIQASALPAVIGHRGASGLEPENTLAAFEEAVRLGVQAVELDIRLSADGVPVVFHDLDLERRTGHAGSVSDLTLPELKGLDASGEKQVRAEIPTFREVLDAMTGRAGVVVEIKNRPDEPVYDSPREAGLRGALEVLRESAFEGPVIVVSFNTTSIEVCRALAPDVPTGFLVVSGLPPEEALSYCREAGHDWVLPRADETVSAGPAFIGSARAAGVRVATWTVDDPDQAVEFFEWGVDAVATNRPDLIVPVRPTFD
jgi:glycerophosphoryl diester phosphodiesterase